MSGLSYRTISAQDLAAAFELAGRDGRDNAFASLRKNTYKIKDISVLMSPVDSGELEAAHKVTIYRNSSDKATYMVSVGGIVNGVDVDAYAMVIHEGINWIKLGPKSLLKQATSPYTVGKKFLERAYEKQKDVLIEELLDALMKGVTDHV